jgi:hypothetical protein
MQCRGSAGAEPCRATDLAPAPPLCCVGVVLAGGTQTPAGGVSRSCVHLSALLLFEHCMLKCACTGACCCWGAVYGLGHKTNQIAAEGQQQCHCCRRCQVLGPGPLCVLPFSLKTCCWSVEWLTGVCFLRTCCPAGWWLCVGLGTCRCSHAVVNRMFSNAIVGHHVLNSTAVASRARPVLQHSTAQHSTAQHSTAQHSTAQHSSSSFWPHPFESLVSGVLQMACACQHQLEPSSPTSCVRGDVRSAWKFVCCQGCTALPSCASVQA